MWSAIGLVVPLLAALTAADYSVKTPPLTTPWTYKVGTNPWPEYPRPQMQRSVWKNLNGVWTYQAANGLNAVNNPPFGKTLANDVLIPSCLESGLSGIQGNDTLYSWFQTKFSVPQNFHPGRTILNFGAVDFEATVFVNSQKVGTHRGGYFEFGFDVTQYLKKGQENELLVFVFDPTDSEGYDIPLGKQTLVPSHIFYRPCSGIWQTVWLENAPANRIKRLDVAAAMDGMVTVTAVTTQKQGTPVKIAVRDSDGSTVGHAVGKADKEFKFKVNNPKLWSPDSPNLYTIKVRMGDDVVTSYTGFRTISSGMVKGVQRPLLNGEFIFMMGTLDQGFWPDGIYTPPNYEAMTFDLKTLKSLGFNMLRKHIKVENHLFYYACDKMGIMLIQDMPAMQADILPNATQQAEFVRELELMVNQQKNYPSIVTWVIYNEGWGQLIQGYPEFALTAKVKELDPTRLVDSTTGWYDHGAGDYSDNHHYANPQCGSPFYSIPSSPYDPTRIGIQGEFGGIGQNVSAKHLWKVEEAINTINQTYEIDQNIDAWRYRGHVLLRELRAQVEKYACSGAVWTQTTDVEGEVNGLLTYDRRVLRPDAQWKADIKAIYAAAKKRT